MILAGGAGRRAGNCDKGTLIWHGMPLVAHVRDRLAQQVGKILISCNRNAEFYADYADATFPDLRQNYQGPMAGLEAAAQQVETEYVLIAPCDTPLLPSDLAQQLLSTLLAEDLEGCYARSGGRDHYLCALIRRTCLESVGSYLDGGGRAVRQWYAGRSIGAVDFDAEADAFLNINTFDPA